MFVTVLEFWKPQKFILFCFFVFMWSSICMLMVTSSPLMAFNYIITFNDSRLMFLPSHYFQLHHNNKQTNSSWKHVTRSPCLLSPSYSYTTTRVIFVHALALDCKVQSYARTGCFIQRQNHLFFHCRTDVQVLRGLQLIHFGSSESTEHFCWGFSVYTMRIVSDIKFAFLGCSISTQLLMFGVVYPQEMEICIFSFFKTGFLTQSLLFGLKKISNAGAHWEFDICKAVFDPNGEAFTFSLL